MSDWAPNRIWLQRGVGEEGSHTWCEDQIGEDSLGDEIEEAEYVRADHADVAIAHLTAALRSTATMLQSACLVITDKEARDMALEAVTTARAAIQKATGA